MVGAVGSQFTDGVKLRRAGCQCSVFVSQKICVVSTINADVRRFDRARLGVAGRPPSARAPPCQWRN